MEKITVKQYAELQGVSLQAVYKQMKSKKNQELLEGHIEVIGGRQYLDEEAVKILEAGRQTSPAVTVQEADVERLETLKTENEQLRNQIMLLLQESKSKSEKITELLEKQNENMKLIATGEALRIEVDRLQEEEEQLQRRIDDQEFELRHKNLLIENLREELKNERSKSIWQRLFGR